MIWCLILIASFSVFAALSVSKSKESKVVSTFKYSDPVKITIIGDSLAKGTGDEKGSGISTYLPEYLKNNITKDISVYNAGVDGLKSEGLLEQLKSGQLDDQLKSSQIIVLSIGGNDILSLSKVSNSERLDALKETQEMYMDNLKEIIKAIRDKSPEGFIIFTGLYNPQGDGTNSLNTMLLKLWNNSTKEFVEEDPHSAFIDTLDIFNSDSKNYISSDRLHPNSDGYRAVSEKMAQLIQSKNSSI